MGVGRILLALALGSTSVGAAAQSAERDLEAATKRLNALDSWIDDAGKRLAAAQRRLAGADRRIAKSEQAIADLDARIRQLNQQREEQAGRLAEHLRAAWRMSARDVLKLLLNDDDPVAVERMARYQGYLADARARALRALQDTAAAAIGHRAERARAQETQLAQRADRRRSAANLRKELANKGRERERLAADQQRLRQLIVELGQRAARSSRPRPAVARAADGLAWPVQGRLKHRFGQARAGGRMRWQGIHIQATLGAQVRAVSGGEIVFADWLRGFGMLIIVDHGGGRMSLYGYADALFKRVGERVEAGEVIASAGRSGGQDEAGLYLEVRQDGEPVDPLRWLRPSG